MVKSRRRAMIIAAAMLGGFVAGCKYKHNNAPVAADQAREILRTALDSWKKGEKMDALQKASPPIYVSDPEWQEGAVLRDYQIVGNGEEKDAHLFSSVKLTVRGTNGQEATREVTFIISTAPNRTVHRKVF